ncbi:hypothetical protein L195_g031483 [Trifolium pratense]|uniref:Cysteine-rich receptor-like protein kinase n=1 Tax=Trifolium pratense TaxID=57577 RepID=A0A2K3LAJ4_TRIPR|nr:hypothetical protein L195_g029605 [Trifolium pratense]PNX74995.1 hypothetical protein L195_g030925 [Trifolium pratense]PNX75546.1 hypothetical protein L195_g031483 [Trifolium pratense]
MGRWCVGVGVPVEETSLYLGAGSPSWAPRVVGLRISFHVCGFLVLELRLGFSLVFGSHGRAPLKVVVFSWQLLQDKILSRQNLLSRRVLATPESWEYVPPRDLLGHFEAFVGLGVDKRSTSPSRRTIWWKRLNVPIGFGSLVRPRVTLVPYMSGGWNPPCAGLDRGGDFEFPRQALLWLVRLFLLVRLLELGSSYRLGGVCCRALLWCASVFGVLALVAWVCFVVCFLLHVFHIVLF